MKQDRINGLVDNYLISKEFSYFLSKLLMETLTEVS